ncbi:hypothetical protein ACP70R_038416 [Stipagrostis hirtigluma subsp. patula]
MWSQGRLDSPAPFGPGTYPPPRRLVSNLDWSDRRITDRTSSASERVHMAAGAVVSDDNRCLRFLRRHPHLELALIPAMLGAVLFAVCWLMYGPPEFTATVSSFDGLDPSHRAAGAPTFAVTLRATNRRMWQFCFKPGNGSAVVAYAGVPLARADVPGFCVPGRSVAKVRVVATGDGLGLPAALHERVEAQRRRRERVPLTVRVRLDEDRVVPHSVLGWPPMLLLCEAMLNGRPAGGPPRCPGFGMGF